MASTTAATMRDHTVAERASTPLELLFDLSFVVAVAFLAAELHHAVSAGDAVSGAVTYALLFIPVWWAWMSYTWYATAFSHDDPVHRVLTIAQMGGVLAVAATVPAAYQGDLLPFAIAYSLMRLPLVLQWLRSAAADPAHRGFALTYAAGSVLAQVLWVVGALPVGAAAWPIRVLALAVELATPMLAVRRSPGPVFHAGHIAERYGLFTLIVLGETLLAVATGLRDAVEGATPTGRAAVLAASALVIAFTLWWIYFDRLGREGLQRNRRAAFVWGYGHYLLFAAIAAVGAGVQAQLDLLAPVGEALALPGPGPGRAAGDGAGGALAPGTAAAAVALPVALILAAVAWLQHAANRRGLSPVLLGAAAGAAVLALVGGRLGVLATDALLALLLILAVIGDAVIVGPRRGRGAG